MGNGGSLLSTAQLTRIGIVFLALILVVVSLFTAWWVASTKIEGQFGNTTRDTDAKPYAAGDFADDENDGQGLSSEVIWTGLFQTLAAIGVLALLAVEVLPVAGKSAPPWARLAACGLAVVLGLTAVLFTAFAWPKGADDTGRTTFFDSDSNDFQGTTFTTHLYPGLGWYFAIVGAILLPALAVGLYARQPDALIDPVPPAPVPPPMAPSFAPAAPRPAERPLAQHPRVWAPEPDPIRDPLPAPKRAKMADPEEPPKPARKKPKT